MTRDGAVAQNLATGEEVSLTSREPEADFSESTEHNAEDGFDLAQRAAEVRRQHGSRKAEAEAQEFIHEGSTVRKRPSSRMAFTEEEQANPDFQKFIRRSDRAADKLDAAKEKIPTRRISVKERVFDETTGKGKVQLRFEELEKVPSGKLRHSPLSRPVSELHLAAHGKIREVEQDNVGVEAGHKAEELAEREIAAGSYRVRRGLHQRRLKPWRDAAKAEQAAEKANAEVVYQRAMRDNPGLAASNPISRYVQKKRIQRRFVSEMREAANATAAATGRTARNTGSMVKDAVRSIKRHSRPALIVIGIFACVALLFGGISSCSILAGSGVGSVFSSSYLSEDNDIQAAEAAYAGMEAELQAKLDNYQNLYPGYDEYHFDLDEIEHDPYVLISILSALHEGTFTIEQVQGDLAMLFEKQYILTETTETETRYRTETRTGERLARAPNTGKLLYDRYGNLIWEEYEYEVEVPYTYETRYVKLENFNLSHVPVYIMGEDSLSMYATYMGALGNRQDLFPSSEYIPRYSTPPNTYEIPPEAMADEAFAAMITEAEKYLGYPYVWGGSNPNTSFDCSGFVSWVINHSGWNVGRLGAQGLYNICTPVSSAQAQPGDLIFFEGTYDTTGASHCGIYVGGGMMIHCGDPISYANVNTSYWQAHFLGFGRLP